MKFYEIDEKLEELLELWNSSVDEETGEILDDGIFAIEDEINDLQLEKEEKLEGVACYYKALVAEAEAIKYEEKKLARRRASIENKAEKLKEFIAVQLDGDKLKTPKVTISFRTSDSVDVTDVIKLIDYDDGLVKYSEPLPKKMEIRKLLKQGVKIPGCKLVTNMSTIIK